MEKVWYYIRRHWLSLLLGVIFSVIFISFVYSVSRDPNLSQALVALGTLILALVTSLTIINSNEREKRQRKERLLNEIIEWATDVLRCCHQFEIPLLGSGSGELLLRRIEANRVTKLGEIACTSQYLMVVASKMNTELFDTIQSVVKEIGKTREVLMERANIETKLDEGKVKQKEVDNIVAKYDEQLKKLELEAEALIVSTTDAFNVSI